jgi:hypothetical protein
MPNNTINRLNELNKLWFKLNFPKKGDKVKFKIKGESLIYEGFITETVKDGSNYKFNLQSNGLAPSGRHEIILVECNGVSFEELADHKKLKCGVCGEIKDDVSIRNCGYDEEINGEKKEEQICDDCEHEHLMDI